MERTAILNPVQAQLVVQNHNGTMNCAKIKKHRRGTLKLEVLSYDWDSREFRFRLVPNVGYIAKIYDQKTKRNYRFHKRRITDFRWLLRKSHTPNSTGSSPPTTAQTPTPS